MGREFVHKDSVKSKGYCMYEYVSFKNTPPTESLKREKTPPPVYNVIRIKA